MMTMRIRAATATELEDLNTFAVVLTEERDGSGARLELQRALEFEEQDHALGMGTYCTCLTNGECHYGGIRKCTLKAPQLLLEFSEKAASTLGIDEQLALELDIDSSSLDQIRKGIPRIFEGLPEHPELLGFEL